MDCLCLTNADGEEHACNINPLQAGRDLKEMAVTSFAPGHGSGIVDALGAATARILERADRSCSDSATGFESAVEICRKHAPEPKE